MMIGACNAAKQDNKIQKDVRIRVKGLIDDDVDDHPPADGGDRDDDERPAAAERGNAVSDSIANAAGNLTNIPSDSLPVNESVDDVAFHRVQSRDLGHERVRIGHDSSQKVAAFYRHTSSADSDSQLSDSATLFCASES